MFSSLRCVGAFDPVTDMVAEQRDLDRQPVALGPETQGGIADPGLEVAAGLLVQVWRRGAAHDAVIEVVPPGRGGYVRQAGVISQMA